MMGLVLPVLFGVSLAMLERWGERTRRPHVRTGVRLVVALILTVLVVRLLVDVVQLGLSVSVP